MNLRKSPFFVKVSLFIIFTGLVFWLFLRGYFRLMVFSLIVFYVCISLASSIIFYFIENNNNLLYFLPNLSALSRWGGYRKLKTPYDCYSQGISFCASGGLIFFGPIIMWSYTTLTSVQKLFCVLLIIIGAIMVLGNMLLIVAGKGLSKKRKWVSTLMNRLGPFSNEVWGFGLPWLF